MRGNGKLISLTNKIRALKDKIKKLYVETKKAGTTIKNIKKNELQKMKLKKRSKIIKKDDNMEPVAITVFQRMQGFIIYGGGALLFSFFTRLFVNTEWYSTFISLFVDLLTFYIWHFQSHYELPFIPFNDVCHKIHKTHHYNIYPPNDFHGEKYKKTHSVSYFTPKGDSFTDTLKNASFAIFLFLIFTFIKVYYFSVSLQLLAFMTI